MGGEGGHGPRSGVEIIDQARDDYAAGRLDRAAAIDAIMWAVDVTQLGAKDLLDHPDPARKRYDASFSSLRELAGES